MANQPDIWEDEHGKRWTMIARCPYCNHVLGEIEQNVNWQRDDYNYEAYCPECDDYIPADKVNFVDEAV